MPRRGLMTVPRACKVIACAIAATQMVECAPVNSPFQPSSNFPSNVDAGDSYYGPPFQPPRVAPALNYATRPLKDLQSHRHDTPQTPVRRFEYYHWTLLTPTIFSSILRFLSSHPSKIHYPVPKYQTNSRSQVIRRRVKKCLSKVRMNWKPGGCISNLCNIAMPCVLYNNKSMSLEPNRKNYFLEVSVS